MKRFIRTEKLLGTDGLERLQNSSVLLFGLGGVGSYTAEALARSGVGRIGLVDFDIVAFSNINRQLIATEDSISKKKTDVEKERLMSINSNIKIDIYDELFDEKSKIDFNQYDYIIDAIDSIPSKVEIALRAKKMNIKLISCLSTGNKLDGTKFTVTDIFSTKVCPLARILRKKLKEVGVDKLKVVYSEEPPAESKLENVDEGKNIGSLAFVTGVAGLVLAGEVVKELAKGD